MRHALLLAAALMTAIPGIGVGTARAQDDRQPATLADQFFRVEWTATDNFAGGTTISGYVYNNHRQAADHVELRIMEFDLSRTPTTSSVQPMTARVPALDRAYFEMTVPGHAAFYRVAVESFDLVDGTRWWSATP